MTPTFEIEQKFPHSIVCGIDEAGRGPIAGPVVAACAIVSPSNYPEEINDSKKLSKTKRRKIFIQLKEQIKFGIGIIDEAKIDEINILQATKLAMFEAYKNLIEKYNLTEQQTILVDGNFIPFDKNDNISEILPIVKGDQKSISIASASIIAKETRDDIMADLGKKYPEYGFEKHAGYPTKFHIDQVNQFGVSPVHRKTFEPIKSILSTK